MAGFGIGGFGIGEFGIGGLTTGVGALTTSTKQVVWRSDMIVTAGFTAIFDATYQVTVHTDCQSAVGTGGLTIASDDAIVLTGTPLVANSGTGSLSIASSAVSYNSTPLLQPSLTSLTFSPLPTTIIGNANLYPSAVALATNTEQVSTVIDQVITTQLGGQASQAFQVSTILDHNLSVGATSLTIAEQAADVITDVKVYPNASSLGSSVGYQVSTILDQNIPVGYTAIFDAQYQVSLVIGNTIGAGIDRDPHETLTIAGKQTNLRIDNNISVGLGNQFTTAGYQPSLIIGNTLNVSNGSLAVAVKSTSLNVGINTNLGVGTLNITGKQTNLRIGNTIPLNLGSYQFTTLAPLPLTGSFEPAGRTIAPQRQSRQLVASFLSADGNDLVVTKIAQEQSRKISQQVNDQNGNDVQRVA